VRNKQKRDAVQTVGHTVLVIMNRNFRCGLDAKWR